LEKDKTKGPSSSADKEYVFYEGPPTANGKPGIHHLEARAFKDAIPRYKTMQGYHVRRKGGWDTHGLPVELQVEKKLGLTSKRAIEEYGIAKFNKECKESVWEYTDLWEKFTERIGYWVDQKNPYVTYHNDYIESVWNVIKTANDKNLLYKDYKVVPWCPRCGTTLSSHELAQGYEDVKDLSVYVKFKVKGQDNTYIIAWTTTPWTLPGNVALAVGRDIDYVKIVVTGETGMNISKAGQIMNSFMGQIFYVAKERIESIHISLEGRILKYEVVEEMKGKDLIGLEYEPLYPFLKDTISDSEKQKLEKAFKVYGADFVTTEDGTGVVHTAVMYGVDDFNLGTEIGLPKHHLVGLDGKFLEGTGFLEGRFVREINENGKPTLAVDIIDDLKKRNLFFKQENYLHSYPHCWRCKTALIYYARDSWYIRMSALRNELVKENESINWEPAYIKDGRFGEWLKEIKDWAISRERYWGTPLPVWQCDKCQMIEVLGSIESLKIRTKKSGNKYFIMRHGEADNNILDIISTSLESKDHLTEKGKDQVEVSARQLKDKKIDLIICSPILRGRETALIVADVLGIEKESIVIENSLREMVLPDYEGEKWITYHKEFPNTPEFFYKTKDGNESWNDIKIRSMRLLYDLEKKYENKNILMVSHGGPSWLLVAGTMGLNVEDSLNMIKNFDYLKNAEYRELDFTPLPHNENYELDLHKPYIDEVELECTHSAGSGSSTCGGRLERSKEVMDVWLDSGTMPFSQDHYPFENKELIDSGKGYPADFISEAIDQTRGWFYTLHAVGAIMGKGKAYKNVICLGHVLDAKGKKMSKSIGNVVDPWQMIEKYGADTLRLFMYSVNQPGESKNFDEKTVSELNNKVFNLLYNVLTFYELYRDKELEKENYKSSINILDQWIIARFGELVNSVTSNLDNYKLLEPVRAIRDFIDDLSTWYVRRSRERLKSGDIEAKKTLYYILKNLAKLMAPFAPFASEDIWQKLKVEGDEESIHLTEWPKSDNVDPDLISAMLHARNFVTMALMQRQKVGIPVRQPLSKIEIKHNAPEIPFWQEVVPIICDEVNVKKVILSKELGQDDPSVKLDTEITSELQQEGQYRELVRAIQDMRKKKGLSPNDTISLVIATSLDGQEIINKFKIELLKTVGAKDLSIKENDGEEVKIGDLIFVINLVK
jgi:isoleucyl-tRNA synthetase